MLKLTVTLLALGVAAVGVSAQTPNLRGAPEDALAELVTALQQAQLGLSAAEQLRIFGPKPALGGDRPVPDAVINLDTHPEQRWQALAHLYKEKIAALAEVLRKYVSPSMLPILQSVMEAVGNMVPEEYQEEMRGLAKAVDQPYGNIVLQNLFYEIASGCTSIVATRRGSNGDVSILHGRNLDLSLPGLADLEVTAHFQRGGKTLYVATTYFGYVGVLTGMRPGSFSLSIDQRAAGGSVFSNFLEALFNGGQSVGFFLRDVLDKESNYQSALKRLQEERLASVSYLVIAGTKEGEGAVVTRDRERAVDVWELNDSDRWFLVETNVRADSGAAALLCAMLTCLPSRGRSTTTGRRRRRRTTAALWL